MSAGARVALAALAVNGASPALASEREVADAWCAEHGGQREVILYGGGRADCITDDYAVEVERAPAWAQSIGQSLWYAALAERRPGIVLIVGPDEYRFRVRLETTIQAHGLDVRVWVVGPGGSDSASASAE